MLRAYSRRSSLSGDKAVFCTQKTKEYLLIDEQEAKWENDKKVTWSEVFADYKKFSFVRRGVTLFRHRLYFTICDSNTGAEYKFFESDDNKLSFSVEYYEINLSLAEMIKIFPVDKVEEYLKERKIINEEEKLV